MDFYESENIFDVLLGETKIHERRISTSSISYANYEYYCLHYPFSFDFQNRAKKEFQTRADLMKSKFNESMYVDYMDGKINFILQQHLQTLNINKKIGLYVFFGDFFIFYQNLNYKWFPTYFHLDKTIVTKLYESLNPSYAKRKLSQDDLYYISEQTKHAHNYENKSNMELLYSVVNLAVEDAINFKRPRNIQEAYADSLQSKIRTKARDLRSDKEKDAYEARIFLLNKKPFLELYLSFMDIDTDFFISRMEKIIKEFDNRPDEEVGTKKKRIKKLNPNFAH